MWRDKDAGYNILGYLMFAVAIEMPFIAYREPRGGQQQPPRTPLEVGGIPHLTPPCEARLPGVRVVCKSSWGGCCGCMCWWGVVVVDIPLGVTAKTMQVEWAT